MRADLVLANWTLFAEGVLVTLQLTAIALAFGFGQTLPFPRLSPLLLKLFQAVECVFETEARR